MKIKDINYSSYTDVYNILNVNIDITNYMTFGGAGFYIIRNKDVI